MLLRLTTIVVVFLLWVPVAQAWSWPVQGPVLRAFSYDEAHPYAAGQHRGIDIGAGAARDPVVAPASGTVSFAGSVPTSGKSVTIETADGYSVTLTHLGSIAVAKGATVVEGAEVGTVGPSGTPEEAGPYVHLGIRTTADANGYLDPLSLLPPLASPPPGSQGSGTTTGSKPVHAHAKPSARGGLVIRARASAPAAAPAVRAAETSRVKSATPRAETRRPAHHRVEARASEPAVVVATPTLAVHAARPLLESAPAPRLPRLRPAQHVQQPLELGLAAGPGVLAGLAAIVIALMRRKRRRPVEDAVVLRLPVRRAA